MIGHQTIYGLHHDTDNYHLHIAVNRMNSESGKVVQPHRGFDIREAHKILAHIENKQGWASEENSMYAILENGELARRRVAQKVKLKQAALDFEHATGEKSAQRIARERGYVIIKNAQSWVEMHEKLAKVGLRFEKKGSGAVIIVGKNVVKASSVDRAFSMGKLCKKLGNFEEGNYPENLEKIAPEPVSSVKSRSMERVSTGVHRRIEKEGGRRQCELAQMKERHRGREKTGAFTPGKVWFAGSEYCPALPEGAAEGGTAFPAVRPEKSTRGQAAF